MSTIMDRKGAEFWWNLPIKGVDMEPFVVPNDVSYYVKDMMKNTWTPVTWKEIHKKRINSINERIRQKRIHMTVKPCIVWVFYINSWIMGGWYTMIKTLDKEYYLNFRDQGLKGNSNELILKVMSLFPYCLPFIEFFDKWMVLFAKENKNLSFYKKRKQGTSFAWCKIDKYGYLEDIAINRNDLIK